ALNVGRVESRKNQVTALRAIERLADLLLVCAGPVADTEVAAQLQSPCCRMLGPVAEGDLDLLYNCAEALVFPSLYEGFGLPVLEAMRRGLPVVTAAVSSLPEVGGDAAVYVDDPCDAEALAAAISRALGDRLRLREMGIAQAAKFTWDRTAAGVAGVVRELVAWRRRSGVIAPQAAGLRLRGPSDHHMTPLNPPPLPRGVGAP